MSYDYWQQKLANPKARIPIDMNDPQPGFYRTREGVAVAIWTEEDGLVVLTGVDSWTEAHHQSSWWQRCADRPVTEEMFRHHEQTGKWPDIDEALAEMGDNVRTGMDEVEQIEELERQVKAYREIDDDETAARAQSLRARLLELKGIVDKKREELKAPHLREARAIDEIWMAPVKKAVGCANALKALIEGWESRKRRRLREEQEAIDRARREAEAANRPPPPPPPPTPEPKPQVRGGTGRAASVREKWVVTGISDLDMALQNYRYSDEVAEAMIKLAQAAIDRGAKEVPGFVIELKAVLR